MAIVASPLIAQRANEFVSAKGSAPAYNAAHELALDGTVQEVLTLREIGRPAGLHLIVAGAAGTIDAHLGPFLDKESREALHTGLPVHVVGDMEEFRGKKILLVRLISLGGRTVTVRNTHGALVLRASGPSTMKSAGAKSANGGAR